MTRVERLIQLNEIVKKSRNKKAKERWDDDTTDRIFKNYKGEELIEELGYIADDTCLYFEIYESFTEDFPPIPVSKENQKKIKKVEKIVDDLNKAYMAALPYLEDRARIEYFLMVGPGGDEYCILDNY